MSNERLQIVGYDDEGSMYGPIYLEADGDRAGLSSQDIEYGNRSKGLDSGLGDGSGSWRLVITADDEHLDVRAYVRSLSSGGPISPLHQLVTSYDVGLGRTLPVHVVPMINPASNTWQKSIVRIFNRKDHYVRVELNARRYGAYGWCDLPPYSALAMTAAELVDLIGNGFRAYDDFLQDKWGLIVRVLAEPEYPSEGLECENGAAPERKPGAVDAIGVMSLVQGANGSITNVSGPLP